MKIRVAVLDFDMEFLNRLTKIFQRKYADRISLSIYTNEDTSYQNLNDNPVDLVLFEQTVKIKIEKMPDGITAGYLSTMPEADMIDGVPAICKYQKAEELYRMMLNLYAEKVSDVKLKRKGTDDTQVVLFTSVQGGSGTSTAAAAYALERVSEKKIFYLNLEKFGDSNLYFQGEGRLSFSDIIYALKSKKGNLAIKLESAIQTDPSGIEFFYASRNAYDMSELSDEETGILIQELMQSGKYKEIVIDISGDLTGRMLMVMKDYADKIVYVADGSRTGNGKFERFCETVRVIEQRQNVDILDKTSLLYNRFNSRSGIKLEKAAVAVLGGIHRFEGLSERELIGEIAQKEIIRRI